MGIQIALLLSFFTFSIFAKALPKEKVDTPPTLNLSVTLPEEVAVGIPNRAQRIFTLEKNEMFHELSNLDELDQDRLYMRLFRQPGKPLESEEKIGPIPFHKDAKTILFFDMNFGPSEIRAARLVARARGENLIVVPERTEAQQDGLEKEYRDWVHFSKLWRDCNMGGQSNCDAERTQMNDAYVRMQTWLNQIEPFEDSKLDGLFEKFEKDGVHLSAIVFSGHSGGSGHLGGFFGSISSVKVKESFEKFPAPLKTVTSMLIWGCYSGTLESLTEYWQKVFPTVQGFIGYRNQAPLGIRDSSGKLLKSYFENEGALLAGQNPKDTHQIFRSLTGVAVLDSTAVLGEYYYAYDQVAKIKDLIAICDNFDESLLQTYRCYNDGLPGCENPPTSHQGPLRTLYSFLQVNRHCLQRLNSRYPGVPAPESLIRLIYIDRVKENFYQRYQKYFQTFADYATEVGLPADLRLENFHQTNRSDDVKRLKRGRTYMDVVGGMRDLSFLDRSNWQNFISVHKIIWGLGEMLSRQPYFVCTPFSWIEPNSKEEDQCSVKVYLEKPEPEGVQVEKWSQFYWLTHIRWLADNAPGLDFLNSGSFESVESVRTDLKNHLDWLQRVLSSYSDRSAVEDRRLYECNLILSQIDKLNDAEFLKYVIEKFTEAKGNAEKVLAMAKANPKAPVAEGYLISEIDFYKTSLQKLTGLAQINAAREVFPRHR